MNIEQSMKSLMFISISIQIALILIGFLRSDLSLLPDNLVWITITFIFYKYYKSLKMIPFLYTWGLMCVFLHSFAIFGAYNWIIFGLPFDRIIHFFTFGLLAIMFIRWYNFDLNIKSVLILLLATIGVGAVVEMLEYTGFLFFGTGNGFFLLGPGDFSYNAVTFEEKFASTWANSMTDMISNLFGAIFGFIISKITKNFSKFE